MAGMSKAFQRMASAGAEWYARRTTSDEAFRFKSKSVALEVWRAQSQTHPLRDDGKPNRPMTAVHCEIGDFPEQS